MSFAEWSNKKKKKEEKEKQQYNSFADWSNAKQGITEEEKESALSWRKDEPAPTKDTKEKDTNSWFKAGGFSDGVDGVGDFFGDLGQTVLGTAADLGANVLEGVSQAAEGAADTAMYLTSGMMDVMGKVSDLADTPIYKDISFADVLLGDFIFEKQGVDLTKYTTDGINLFSSEMKEIAKKNATQEAFEFIEGYTDEYSVLGDKTDSVANGVGQVATMILLSYAGGAGGMSQAEVSALTSGFNFLSGMGSGMSEAYSTGASDSEAVMYGGMKGSIEMGTELISGGLGKGAKALGLSSGAFGIDDIVAKKLTSQIGNKFVKYLAQSGIKATGEGLEEVLAGFLTACAKKATYMTEEDINKLIEDEQLLDSFIIGTLTSSIAQAPSVASSIKTGQDFITGYTKNDQTVIDKEVEKRVAEKEQDGTKLTKRQINKIREQVESDMEKGYISIDTIEETLGGDSYKAYKDSLEQDEARQKEYDSWKEEYDSLYKMKYNEKSDEDFDRQKELEDLIDGYNPESNTNSLKEQMSKEVEELAKSGFLAESYNERARKGEAFQADLSKYDGTKRAAVERAIKSGVLNNTNRSHELVDILSTIEADKGIVFDYTNNEKLKETGFALEGKTVNGFVNNGAVTLNVQSPKAWQSTVGHEIGHVLEGTDAYSTLQQSLFAYAKSKGELDSRRAKLTELYANVDADIDAELTADLLGDYLFNDSKFIKSLTTNKNVFQKVYNEIKYLCKTATGKELTEIEQVRREFDKAWKELGKKGVTAKEGIDYSVSAETDTEYMSAVESGDIETQERIVADAAKKAGAVLDEDGNPLKLYRGTKGGQTVFSKDVTHKGKIYTTDKVYIASNYGDKSGETTAITDQVDGEPTTYALYGFPKKMLTMDAQALPFNDLVIPEELQKYSPDSRKATNAQIAEWAEQEGYDALRIKDVRDGGAFGWNDQYIFFDENLVKSADAITEDNDGNVIPLSQRFNKANDDIRFSLSEDTDGNELSLAVQKRFANSKAVDENGKLKVLYHGTANGEFYTFDKSKGSVEGDFGSGFYFTDNETDVENNYEGGGPDFENKIWKRAEQIYDDDPDISMDEAKKKAQEELYKGSFKHTVYLNIENPAIVGETYLFDYDSYAENYNRDDYDTDEDYEGDIEQLISDDIDQILWDIERNIDVYGFDDNTSGRRSQKDAVAEVLWNAVNEGGIDLEKLKANINNLYLEDINGNLVGNEVTRQIVESLGYDGIIDPTVSHKWNMEMEEGTTHYIVFKPNQIKSIDNQNPTDNPDIRKSLSQQGEQFAPTGDYSTPMNELALAPTQEDISAMESTTTEDAPTEAAPSIDEAPLPDDAMYDDAPLPSDFDVPPVMEDNYYAEPDTTPISENSLKFMGDVLRKKLNLTASDTKAMQEIIQEYATSENPNKAEPLDKITKRFGEVVTTEKDNDLSAIKKYIRETPLYIDDTVKNNITDWADFRKRLNGKIKFAKNPNEGFYLDKYYANLVEQFPGTFNLGMDNQFGDLDNHLNQLQKIEAVLNEKIYKEKVDTRHTKDLKNAVDTISSEVFNYKQSLTRKAAEDTAREALDSIAPLKAVQLTDGSRSDALLNQSLDNHPVQTVEQKVAENIRALEANIADLKQLRRESWQGYNEQVAEISNTYENLKNKNTIKANDMLSRASRLERLKASNDANFGKRLSDLEARLEKMKTDEYNRAMHKQDAMQGYADWAADTLGDTTYWKDKKIGLQYSTNTEHRNLRDIVRDANGNKDIAKADAIYDATMGEYNRNQAAKNRKVAEVKKQFADMEISKAESTYIQMLGEFRHNPDTTLTEEDVKKYYEKHKRKIDTAKVDNAIELARQTYDNALTELNTKLREQGMKEIPYRKGYFPHFTDPKQNFIQKLFNWKTQDTEIPTSIAGLTEDFKPNKSYQSFDKTRHSDKTDYNFLKGLDTYLEGAYDWIYHLEDIQKRRAIENHIRYTHSEEGKKAKIKEVYADENLDADEAQAKIEQILGEAENPLNNFVQDYMTHTNILTNKKNSYDRGMERALNRNIYSTMTNVQNRVSANMVLANVRSALTNFIPITQSWSQVSPLRSLQATKDVIKNSIKDDGLVNKSTFLTNRLKEADNLYKDNWDKVLDKAGIMFEVVDNFSSQVIWRSKYNDNLKKGMTEAEAIKNADQFAENVMAGRSKGNEPTLFNAKNPLVKAFTMFQLEVNNQYGYLLKDVPTDLKAETKHWKLNMAKGYTTAFIGAYVYNALMEQISGSGAALDPIGIIEELLNDLGFGDDEEEKEPGDVLGNLAENVVQEVPFVGGLFGGGRIPISSALPYKDDGLIDGLEQFTEDFGGTAKAVYDWVNGEEADWSGAKNLGKEMMNPLLNVVLPVGGGQIKKTTQGLDMFNTDYEHPIAGSYTDSGELRFPVEDTTANRIQAALFGQWANENARNYIENGRKPLSEKQTEEFIDTKMPIADYWEYRDGLKGLKKNSEKADYINSLDIKDWQKNILINNILDRKEDVDMSNYDDFADWEEFDYAQKNPEKYAVAKSVGGYSSYKSYSNDLNDIKADKDIYGNSINGSRKEKVLDYINNLDADYETRLILFKSEYPSDRTYDAEIINYINNRGDLTYEERISIFEELGFKVIDGQIYY